MKSHGWPIAVGISFVALSILLAGCPVEEKGTYPNNLPRPPGGGGPDTTNGSSGGGGAGGMGGTGGGNGGAGGGCDCPPVPCRITQCGVTEKCVYESHEPDGTLCGKDMLMVCSKGDCGRAPGQPCNSGMECASEVCANDVCCTTECNTSCKACNIPGKLGSCDFLPKGWPDNSCPMGQSCDGFNGDCVTGTALGQPCLNKNACASNECVTNRCRLGKGEPCNDPVQCASNYCASDKCADAPMDPKMCSSKESSGTICLAAPGEPCGNDLGCASTSFCTGGICKAKNGTTCTNYYQCNTNFCNIPAGQTEGTCADCDDVSDCGGDMCTGVCPTLLAPEGAYCIENVSCTKGLVCTGFPRKCAQPMP
jgi:hypothetical protein